MKRNWRPGVVAGLVSIALLSLNGSIRAQTVATPSKHLAPGFSKRTSDSTLVVVPVDMELFSITAGGVPEPKADWTEAATKHFRAALDTHKNVLGSHVTSLEESDLDALADLNALHGAVAQSIFRHHALANLALPTKEGRLDWSLGDAVQPLREKTGADYALFVWIRDSYASAERKATMVLMAMIGVGIQGGFQVGYASLVDLRNGQVVWFNNLLRASGDLREAAPAKETVEALLQGFPPAQ